MNQLLEYLNDPAIFFAVVVAGMLFCFLVSFPSESIWEKLGDITLALFVSPMVGAISALWITMTFQIIAGFIV